jgi:hypothetical protein
MIYDKARFKIKEIWSDNKFRPLQEALSTNFGIGMNFANPPKHVPETERNNQVIKERVRATYHCLPYMGFQSIIVQECSFTRGILTVPRIVSLPVKLMYKRMTSQVQQTNYLLKCLTVSIYDTETHIKVVMSFYIYQQRRSS